MAAQYFLNIDGVPGESVDNKHKDQIEVFSFSWGVSQTSTLIPPAGAASAGKVAFSDLTLSKTVDRSSPKLFQACTTGTHLPTAVLSIQRTAGDTPEDYLVYKFADVLVSSYQTSGSSENPTESVSFNFSKIEIDYSVQQPAGGLVPVGPVGWDLQANRKA